MPAYQILLPEHLRCLLRGWAVQACVNNEVVVVRWNGCGPDLLRVRVCWDSMDC